MYTRVEDTTTGSNRFNIVNKSSTTTFSLSATR
jgi:hypothetical protein